MTLYSPLPLGEGLGERALGAAGCNWKTVLTFKYHAEVNSLINGFSIRGFTMILAATLLISVCAGCKRNTSSEDETPDTSTYRPQSTPATQFERDLKYIRDGHFTHVWVFSRKDGKGFTKEDSEALRTNAPTVVDWVTTDANKRVIGGSNFDIDPPQMAALQKRFKVEDYSGK